MVSCNQITLLKYDKTLHKMVLKVIVKKIKKLSLIVASLERSFSKLNGKMQFSSK